MIPLYEIPSVIKFIGTKIEWWFTGAGEGGEELVFNRYRVSVNALNCTLESE